MNLKVGGLCSGVGGFELGFQRAGHKVAWLVEWNTNCQAVIRKHFKESFIFNDVKTVDCNVLEDIDVVVAGSPCQSMSYANNNRNGFEGKSGLFYNCLDIVKAKRPRFFVWENVCGALTCSGGWDFAAVLCELSKMGAKDIAWRVLDSREFGIPQARRRIYLVADFEGESAGQSIGWNEDLDGQRYNVLGGWTAGMMLRSAEITWAESGRLNAKGLSLANVPNRPKVHNVNDILADVVEDKYLRVNLEAVLRQARRHAEPWELEIIEKAGVWPSGEAVDKSCKTYVLSHNFAAFMTSCSTTLTRSSAMWIINANRIRMLTPVERERLQGFPANWTAEGIDDMRETVQISDRERYSMCGNAVTVDCPQWVAARMAREAARENKDEWAYIDMPDWAGADYKALRSKYSEPADTVKYTQEELAI